MAAARVTCQSPVLTASSWRKLPRTCELSDDVRVPLQVPADLGSCGALAWVSLAGNPTCPAAAPPRAHIQTVSAEQLSWGDALGEGASGDVFAAQLVRCPDCPRPALMSAMHVGGEPSLWQRKSSFSVQQTFCFGSC
jgi:hypothetical protein